MPVYNAGSKVTAALQSAIKKFESLVSESFEVIVVDDGSTDNTRAFLNKIKDGRVTVIGYPVNSGKGAAQIFAFGFAKADTIIFADGDMQAFPSGLRDYIDALEEADVAIASKRVPGAKVITSLKRHFLSIAFNSFVRILLSIPITDTQAGFKVFRRSALEKVLPLISVKRYAFDVELLVVAKKVCNCSIAELPANVTLTSKFRLGNMARMLVDILGIAYRLKLKHWYQNNNGISHEEYSPILRW
ncbi:MAG: glycosyltransferase family 2 protein [Nitrososphaerales archaeon]